MYNALIIGAGQIAGGYDKLTDEAVLTHAHAYNLNDEINLLGFYDINFEQAQKMAEKWGVKAFKTLNEPQNIDIVSICTPDFCHLSSIKESLKLNPKIIFLEKPLSNNPNETSEIVGISKYIPILVNFSRRFVKEFQELAIRIKNNEFGNFKTGTGYYGKGYIHNGSHMLNLLNLLIGKILNVQEIDSFVDFFENDPTKTVILKFEQGNFFMQGVNCNNSTIFEFDLIFEKARIRILNSGYDIEIYTTKESEKYKGYINLELSKTIHTELDFAMKNAVQNLVDFLGECAELISFPYYD